MCARAQPSILVLVGSDVVLRTIQILAQDRRPEVVAEGAKILALFTAVAGLTSGIADNDYLPLAVESLLLQSHREEVIAAMSVIMYNLLFSLSTGAASQTTILAQSLASPIVGAAVRQLEPSTPKALLTAARFLNVLASWPEAEFQAAFLTQLASTDILQRLEIISTLDGVHIQEERLLLTGTLCGAPIYFGFEDESSDPSVATIAQRRLELAVPEWQHTFRRDMRITQHSWLDSCVGPSLLGQTDPQLIVPSIRIMHCLLRAPDIAIHLATKRPMPLAFMDAVLTFGAVAASLSLEVFAFYALRVDSSSNREFCSGTAACMCSLLSHAAFRQHLTRCLYLQLCKTWVCCSLRAPTPWCWLGRWARSG
jgi:hypothetical protein